jgi:zeaxanthin glucosyltransferase
LHSGVNERKYDECLLLIVTSSRIKDEENFIYLEHMSHFGMICPNTVGHLNPMLALADALRRRGHQVTFFLLGHPPASLQEGGFEVRPLGGTLFPADEFQAEIRKLGLLQGRAALKHTFALSARSASAIMANGPLAVRAAGIDALTVDQVTSAGGTVADELGLPFVTVSNALLLNADPIVPPFFTHWQPRDTWWARLRNRITWDRLDQLYTPVISQIQARRKTLGLPAPQRIAEVWSSRLQISQQPAAFEFPRLELPKQVRFVGPLRLPAGYPSAPFPWERLDGRPLIYASLGTLQNRVADNFRALAGACEGLDAQLVISTGNGLAPEALGELPGQPIVVPFAPQDELLRRAALAVTHAGLNTALDALAQGVPMVAVPVTNEQPGIAARIAWVGAGEVYTQRQLTPQRLRPLIERVLKEPSYRAAAASMREAIQASGGAPRAAELIEQSLA